MTDEMSELVETGVSPPVLVAPHAVPIRHSIFVAYQKIAEYEQTTVAVIINDALRKAMGEE